MSALVCPYCGKDVAEEFNFCCGEAGHAIPEVEYAARFGEGDDEGIEDVKAAYVSLFRSYGKLQCERDELAAHLRHAVMFFDQLNKVDADRYSAALARVTA